MADKGPREVKKAVRRMNQQGNFQFSKEKIKELFYDMILAHPKKKKQLKLWSDLREVQKAVKKMGQLGKRKEIFKIFHPSSILRIKKLCFLCFSSSEESEENTTSSNK